jgi:hypothetical protein
MSLIFWLNMPTWMEVIALSVVAPAESAHMTCMSISYRFAHRGHHFYHFKYKYDAKLL